MLKDGKILIGKAGDKEICLIPRQMNRHGLIAGASGTGKTVTLKVIAESLSELGVPTFIADVKGDLTGMIVPGNQEGIQGRLDSMNITDPYDVRKYPVHFFDLYRKAGHPVRAVIEQMDPLLVSRILDLTEAQQGVLNIIFRVAKDMDLAIYDLKDLQAMVTYVGEHSSDLTLKYGNISKQSAGGIQRKLLELENQQGDLMFGLPSLDIDDWMTTEGGMGIMNMMECEELFQHPMLYSTFLLWLLDKLYKELPEVGDLEKPKIVFFFDEAHLLFSNASGQLLDKIVQIVKLVRSKGVGVFFVTQSPADIPSSVLAQLSNRIQHSLRAYTPAEIKATKQAAESFRDNPDLDESELITNMKTGYALVSVLDEDGAPCIVEHTKILPPKSSMEIAPEENRTRCWQNDSLFGKYERDVDPDSAYEDLESVRQQEAALEEAEKRRIEEEKLAAKEQAAREKEEAREAAKAEREKDRLKRKVTNKVENEILNYAARSAKKLLKKFLK
ncbi:MAG TPA: DUF853 domain-containing protein [Erysipelotrichaceae bacterium]|nr:DUF853 domain-containing protein [Erysipelotrichaceae bacterium]